MEGTTYDGMVSISTSNSVPFHFENGEIEFYLGKNLCSFKEGLVSVVGQCHTALTGGQVYFHFPMPIENYCKIKAKDEHGIPQTCDISMGVVKNDVDFYIEGYEEEAAFTQMRFSFSELDYFLPSSNACCLCGSDGEFTDVMFSRTPQKMASFSFSYLDRMIEFSLQIYAEAKCGVKGSALTKAELVLEFETTNDLDFFIGLYELVDDVFCFLCNRKNISLHNVILVGTRTQKYPVHKDGKTTIEERQIHTSQTLVIVDKYKDTWENEKEIRRTIHYTVVSEKFKELFLLFVKGKVSVFSIHSSVVARNLIDLKQSLQITAAFEHYFREYIPNMPSDDAVEFCEEIRALLEEYVNNHTGKKRKRAKSLIKSISPEVSLKDKIIKVYKGHLNWVGVEPILNEWFGSEIDSLAEVANKWRNELAHEKREYEPDRLVISAIRLVEHLNYCIVLRQAEYSDEQIKSIIEDLLVR